MLLASALDLVHQGTLLSGALLDRLGLHHCHSECYLCVDNEAVTHKRDYTHNGNEIPSDRAFQEPCISNAQTGALCTPASPKQPKTCKLALITKLSLLKLV
jgi:hypothetical protein